MDAETGSLHFMKWRCRLWKILVVQDFRKQYILLLIFTKNRSIILQNWVYCLKVNYETICLKYADTLSVIKEVINLYSSRKRQLVRINIKDLAQNRLIYVGPTDVRAEQLRHFH